MAALHSAADEEAPGGKDRHAPVGCGGELRYCWEYDASYCPACDEWTERACSDPSCDLCHQRPRSPSEVHTVPVL